MTAFDVIVGVPLLILYFGGWSALTFHSLRCFTSLSRAACVGMASLAGVAFAIFYFRFTASLPDLARIPLTPEQKRIERMSWVLVMATYAGLLFLLARSCLKRKAQ